MSNSLAIMTDAVHMLADVVGILFSLLALWLSTKPPTKRFTFGLHRLGKLQKPFFFFLPFLAAQSVLCAESRLMWDFFMLIYLFVEFVYLLEDCTRSRSYL